MYHHKELVASVFLIAICLANADAATIAPGELVKGSLPAVYYINDEGKRLVFPDERTFFSWYPNFDSVKKITNEELADIELSGAVTVKPGVKMVKIESDPKVYAVEHGGTLRWISSESVARSIYGDNWNKLIIDIPVSLFTQYVVSEPVAAAQEYSPAAESAASTSIGVEQATKLIARSSSTETPTSPTSTPTTTSTPNTDTTPEPESVAPGGLETTPTPTPNPDPTPEPEPEPEPTVLQPVITPASASPTVKNLLVLLWDPQDTDGRKVWDKQVIDDLIFGTGTSVKNYYAQESGGSVTINKVGVMGWYSALKPASHYWATPDPTDADGAGYIHRHNEKWAESILDADPEFDFSAYDTNGDHYLSPSTELGVLIVIPAITSFGTNRWVWGQEYPSNQALVVDGVTVGTIAEVYTNTSGALNFGTFAHELGHLLLSFPDMYMTSPYRAYGYSIFDATYCNCMIDPWNKLRLNWTNQAVPSESGLYELSDIAVGNTVMKIARPGSEEFFLIENREFNAYQDTGEQGLLVWDIISPSTSGDWGRNNIHLLRSNGGSPLDDNSAAYHGTSESVLGTTGELSWSDGTLSGITLSDISIAGSTMRFTLTMP